MIGLLVCSGDISELQAFDNSLSVHRFNSEEEGIALIKVSGINLL